MADDSSEIVYSSPSSYIIYLSTVRILYVNRFTSSARHLVLYWSDCELGRNLRGGKWLHLGLMSVQSGKRGERDEQGEILGESVFSTGNEAELHALSGGRVPFARRLGLPAAKIARGARVRFLRGGPGRGTAEDGV